MDKNIILEKLKEEFSLTEKRTDAVPVHLALYRYLALELLGFKVGHRLSPLDIGKLASAGAFMIEVFDKPKVGIISMGDELVSAIEDTKEGKVRDSNSLLLSALFEEIGCERGTVYLVKDNKEALLESLLDGLRRNDIIVFTGGKSQQKYEMAKDSVNQLGMPGVIIEDLEKQLMIGVVYDLQCACCVRKTAVFKLSALEGLLLENFNDVVKPFVEDTFFV